MNSRFDSWLIAVFHLTLESAQIVPPNSFSTHPTASLDSLPFVLAANVAAVVAAAFPVDEAATSAIDTE